MNISNIWGVPYGCTSHAICRAVTLIIPSDIVLRIDIIGCISLPLMHIMFNSQWLSSTIVWLVWIILIHTGHLAITWSSLLITTVSQNTTGIESHLQHATDDDFITITRLPSAADRIYAIVALQLRFHTADTEGNEEPLHRSVHRHY
jgi:hypothetical protein